MITAIKNFFKRKTIIDTPKEPSLSEKIFTRVLDDLTRNPSYEWKETRSIGDNERVWEHPNVAYTLKINHYRSIEPSDVPYGILDDWQRLTIARLWNSQISDRDMQISNEKFDNFLTKTGLK